MSTGEMLYLVLVLCAVCVFAGVLFTQDWQQGKGQN